MREYGGGVGRPKLGSRNSQCSLKISVCGPPRTNLDVLFIPRTSSSLQPSQLYGLPKCIRLWPACFVAGRSRVTNFPKTRKSFAEVRVTKVLSSLCCVVIITLQFKQVLFGIFCVIIISLHFTQVLFSICCVVIINLQFTQFLSSIMNCVHR
jgi:hypothetical protein